MRSACCSVSSASSSLQHLLLSPWKDDGSVAIGQVAVPGRIILVWMPCLYEDVSNRESDTLQSVSS